MKEKKRRRFSRKIRQIGRRAVTGVKLLCAIAILAVLVTGIRYWLQNSDVFRITQVEITGASILTEDDISDLIPIHEIEQNQRIFDIDVESYKKKIEAHPYIAFASLGRKFPKTLKIELSERIPVAYLILDKIYLVDKEGYLLPKITGKEKFADCPVITGITVSKPILGSQIQNERLLNGLSFLQKFEVYLPDFKNEISEIHYNKNGEITMFMSENGVKIEFGLDDFERKLLKLRYFITHYESNYRLNNLLYINLNYRDQVIIKEVEISQ